MHHSSINIKNLEYSFKIYIKDFKSKYQYSEYND